MPSGVIAALLGGALIGLAATLFWAANQRVAGVSGILRGALRGDGGRREPVAFLLGLVSAGLIGSLLRAPPVVAGPPIAVLLVAGLLVGFGTRVGGGCTSGHGVCGVSRLRARSLVATLVFVAVGALTVFVIRRGLPSWGVR